MDFNPAKPWDVVFREAALDTKFWDREVDKQVVFFHTNVKTVSKIVDTGTGPIDLVGSDTPKKNPSQAAPSGQGVSKRAAKKKNKAVSAAKGGGKGGKGAGKGAKSGDLADVKGKDGKYTRSKTGEPICWAFNKGTCSTPCSNKRWHMCE